MAVIATLLLLASADPQSVAQTARGYLGEPYHFGGTGTYGYDCSGFVREVYSRFGIELPRTARAQAEVGQPVARESIEAGDLIFFVARPGSTRVTHVGIALGDGGMVHASTERGRIVEDPLSQPYYQVRLVGIRRVLGVLAEGAPSPLLAVERSRATRVPLRLRGPLSAHAWSELMSAGGELRLDVGVADAEAGHLGWTRAQWTHTRADGSGALALELPWAVALESGTPAWEAHRPRQALRLLELVAIAPASAPGSGLWVGRGLVLSLGRGALMRSFTPALTRAGTPRLWLEPWASATIRATAGSFAAEAVLDDLWHPSVAGLRLERGRSWLASLEATSARGRGTEGAHWAIGVGLASPALEGDRWLLRGDASLALQTPGRPAAGLEAGGELRVGLGPTRWRLAGRATYHDSAFVPGLVGPDFLWTRSAFGAYDGVFELQEVVAARPIRTAWTYLGEISLELGRYAVAGLSLQHAPSPLGLMVEVPMSWWRAELGLAAVELPGGAGSLSGAFAAFGRSPSWGLGDRSDLSHADSQSLSASVAYRPWRFVSLGAALARRRWRQSTQLDVQTNLQLHVDL